jgi:hypothetical protein
LQEQVIQTSKDIADHYLEYQREVINLVQSIFAPYVENTNNNLSNNQEYFRKFPEIYSNITTNCAQNIMYVNRMVTELNLPMLMCLKLFLTMQKNIQSILLKLAKEMLKFVKRNRSK